MKRPSFLVFAILFAALVVTRAASADVCVEIDAARDNLSPADRSGVRTMLAHSFEEAGQHVVATGCATTYRAYNVQLGASVTAVLEGPTGSRTMTVHKIEEVPSAYSQMVRSLLSGQPLSTESSAMTRNNVTNAQVMPNRAEADKVWFIRLGYGGTRDGEGLITGPAFGFGLRYELDRIAVEPSFLNFLLVKDDKGSYGGFIGEYIRLRALYFFDPVANSTLYVGAGVAWGGGSVRGGAPDAYGVTGSYTGSGLGLNAAIGYEMLRASTIRLFAEVDGAVPLYNLKHGTDQSLYVPIVALSLGIGWGGHPAVVVKNVD